MFPKCVLFSPFSHFRRFLGRVDVFHHVEQALSLSLSDVHSLCVIFSFMASFRRSIHLRSGLPLGAGSVHVSVSTDFATLSLSQVRTKRWIKLYIRIDFPQLQDTPPLIGHCFVANWEVILKVPMDETATPVTYGQPEVLIPGPGISTYTRTHTYCLYVY